MTQEERGTFLERVKAAGAAPLVLVCITPEGQVSEMSLQQCLDSGSCYLHLAMNELDGVLAEVLGDRRTNHRRIKKGGQNENYD